MQVPYELMGWLGPDVAEPEFTRLEAEFIPFAVEGAGPTKPGVPVWEYAKKLMNGQHLPTWRQMTGDCTSMGAAQGGQYMSVFEIMRQRQEETFKYWFPPYTYSMSRLAPECGGGRMGRRAGGTGSWTAVSLMRYGVLFMDDPGVPQYSKELANAWGQRPGPDRALIEIAKNRLVGSAARITTVNDIREALLNYHMVTIASNQGFEMAPVNYMDRHAFRPSGKWAHQMCFIGWQDEPFPGAYRLNSWGAQAHGQPLNGEPPGGAWNHADDIERELKQFRVELYALSLFQGFPAAPDFSIL